jgi:hypothetical protein
MFRIFLIILLIYLIYRFIRNITLFAWKSRPQSDDEVIKPPPAPKQEKIIDKNEGEYVDFEEIKEK